MAQRRDSGCWELPGGKLEDGESLAQCLARELWEELGCRVEVGRVLAEAGDERIHLICLSCRLVEGRPRALEHRRLAWFTPAQALARPLCPADRRAIGFVTRG